MKGSKLVKAISHLNAWELRHLSDFVHSPFFNKHDRVTALMDVLIAAAPGFESPDLERIAIYERLFEGEKFDEQRYKDLLSLAMKTFKSFLAFYRLRQDEYSQGRALLEELSDRKWESEFGKSLKLVEQIAQRQPGQLQELAYRQLRLQELLISFLGSSANRKVEDTVQRGSSLLDEFYLIAKLKYAVEMANRQNVVGQDFDAGLLPPLLSYLAAHPERLSSNPGIQIYFAIYQLLHQSQESGHFPKLLELMHAHVAQLPIDERREVYAYALNYCIQQINRGQGQFLQTLLQLYQQALEDETLLNEGNLSQWDYKNIVTAGLKARNFEWCSDFIETYKEKIEPQARENAYTYNLASLHYEQGDYRQALKLLQHVEFTDVFYHLGSKVLLLKSYYETKDFEALHHLCEAFRVYLKRNTGLSKQHYTINTNLISITKKLADLKSRAEGMGRREKDAQKEKLLAQLEAKGNVAQKSWIMEKLEEV